MPPLRIAAAHASAVFLSASSTTKKTITLLQRAADAGANMIVFPESFIPAFPLWSALRPPCDNHDFFARIAKASILADGEEMHAIRAAARSAGIAVSLGFSERVEYSAATLFNSNIIISAAGRVLNHHRKLVPTFFEKLTWAAGDGYGLRVVECGEAKIGALICGENTNPLARYSLMAQGEQVHISTWPACWPTRMLDGDQGGDGKAGVKNYDNVAANRIRAAAHCFEAKCFGVLCSGFLDDKTIETVATGASNEDSVRTTLQRSSKGATMFLDPTGAVLPGFTIDETGHRHEREFLQEEEGILFADLDLIKCVEGKQYHDVVGGYQRFDIFDLKVNRSRKQPVTFVDEVDQTVSGGVEEEGENAEMRRSVT